MTVTIDNTTSYGRTTTENPSYFTHAGASSGVNGVVVAIVNNGSATDHVTSVSYGGVSLTRYAVLTQTSGETGTAQIWFADGRIETIPQGTQGVFVYYSSATGDDFHISVTTLFGGARMAVTATDTYDSDSADPAVLLTKAHGEAGIAVAALFSGASAPSSTPLTGTTTLSSRDFGQQNAIVGYATSTTSNDTTVGWVYAADDVAMVGVYITDSLLTQIDWRWRKDDGSEAAATWDAAAQNRITVDTASPRRRVRFALSSAGERLNLSPLTLVCAKAMTNGSLTLMGRRETYANNTSGSAWSPDGTKLYTIDASEAVSQHTVSTPWDLSTASSDSKSCSVSSHVSDHGYADLFFHPSGTAFYVSNGNASVRTVYQYTISTPWDVSTASYASKSFSYSTQITSTSYGFCFSSDGSKMYVVDSVNKAIYRYNLSTAWDLSTAQYSSSMLDLGGISGTPTGLAISDDGKQVYFCNGITPFAWVSLSTAWDLSTASSVKTVSTLWGPAGYHRYVRLGDGGRFLFASYPANDTPIRPLVFIDGIGQVGFGTSYIKLADSSYVTDASNTTQQLTSGAYVSSNLGYSELGTALVDRTSISGGTYVTGDYFDATNTSRGWFFHPSGLRAWNLDSTTDTVREYALAVPWKLSSMAEVTSNNFYVGSQITAPRNIEFSPDGLKMYVSCWTNRILAEYPLGTAWDVTTASYQSVSLDFSSYISNYQSSMAIDPTGTKLWVSSYAYSGVHLFTLSTAWDLSTASFTTTYSLWGGMTDFKFRRDGKAFFEANTNSDSLFMWPLSTAWDLSTRGSGSSFSFSAMTTASANIALSGNESYMFVQSESASIFPNRLYGGTVDFAAGDKLEVEYCLEVNPQGVQAGDTLFVGIEPVDAYSVAELASLKITKAASLICKPPTHLANHVLVR